MVDPDKTWDTPYDCSDCAHRSQRTGECPYVAGQRTGRQKCVEFIPVRPRENNDSLLRISDEELDV
jgi:hypothetical protein